MRERREERPWMVLQTVGGRKRHAFPAPRGCGPPPARRRGPPPVLAGLLGDEKPIIVLPVNRRDIYAGVVETFKQRGGVEREAGDVKNSDVKSASLIILGHDKPLLGRLSRAVEAPDAG